MDPDDGVSARERPRHHTLGCWFAVTVVLAVGLALRVPHLDSPPDRFHPARQYTGQLQARWIYTVTGGDVTAAQRRSTEAMFDRVGVLEAPVQPALVALGFHLTGGESWWSARLISIVTWCIGGLLLMLLVERVTDSAAAGVCGFAVYMFLPLGVLLSRALQPEPLMVAMVIGSWLSTLRAYERRRWTRTATTVAATLVAAVLKANMVLFVTPFEIAIAVRRLGWRGALRDRRTVVIVASGPVAAVSYYGLGLLLASHFSATPSGRFVASYFLDSEFWSRWLFMVVVAVGLVGLTAVLVMPFRSRGDARALLVCATCGYLVSSLMFNYRTATHSYYAAPLIPIAAVAVAVGVDALLRAPRGRLIQRTWVPLALAAAIAVAVAPTLPRHPANVTAAQVATARRIGSILHHSSNVVTVDPDYGLELAYDGGISGPAWPNPGDDRLDRLVGASSAPARSMLAAMRREGSTRMVIADAPLTSSYGELASTVAGCRVLGRVGRAEILDLQDCRLR